MPRFSPGSIFCGTLSATAAVCLSFAAAAAPVEGSALFKKADSALFKKSVVACDETTMLLAGGQPDLGPAPCGSRTEEADRSYLRETASPGATMTRQGPETAIARLNPEFVARLANAIREARGSGLPSAGVFSAYRPPGFGIGGFADKFKSLHAYGLAVDMSGIGEPGSKEAKLWHEIAGRNGIFCPYGFDSKTEWNHCQATPIKSIVDANPLRKTITADGPLLLEEMFKVGQSVIDDPAAAVSVAAAANRPNESEAVRPHVIRAALGSASKRLDRGSSHEARNHRRDAVVARDVRKAKTKMALLASETRHLDKSRRKPADSKTHDSRKAARVADRLHVAMRSPAS